LGDHVTGLLQPAAAVCGMLCCRQRGAVGYQYHLLNSMQLLMPMRFRCCAASAVPGCCCCCRLCCVWLAGWPRAGRVTGEAAAQQGHDIWEIEAAAAAAAHHARGLGDCSSISSSLLSTRQLTALTQQQLRACVPKQPSNLSNEPDVIFASSLRSLCCVLAAMCSAVVCAKWSCCPEVGLGCCVSG
jgi:hypothetical protein